MKFMKTADFQLGSYFVSIASIGATEDAEPCVGRRLAAERKNGSLNHSTRGCASMRENSFYACFYGIVSSGKFLCRSAQHKPGLQQMVSQQKKQSSWRRHSLRFA